MHLRPLKCSLYFLFAQLDLFLCPGKSFLFMFNGFFPQRYCLFLNGFLCICLTRWEFGQVIVTWDSALHESITTKCKRLVKRKKENNKFHYSAMLLLYNLLCTKLYIQIELFQKWCNNFSEFWRTIWIKTNQKS